MMRSVNKTILLGNVGKDPVIKETQSGTLVAMLSLATSDRVKGKNGEYKEYTEWHNLVAFQRTAEIIRDYVRKGSKLYVEGKLQTSTWEDRNSGEKRYRTQIVIRELSLLNSAEQKEKQDQPSFENNYAGAPVAYQNNTEITDDDIPF